MPTYTPVTLTFRAARFGVALDDVQVFLSRRQKYAPLIANDAFQIPAQTIVKTVAGVATFQAFSSPDLLAIGLADAYYVLECPDAKLVAMLWIPAAAANDFQGGNLDKLVALTAPGAALPAPGSVIGWSPLLSLVTDGARIVQRIADWIGGVGAKPASGGFVGSAGLVSTAAAAVDVRGAQGVASAVGVSQIAVTGNRTITEPETRFAAIALVGTPGAVPTITLPNASFSVQIINTMAIAATITRTGGTTPATLEPNTAMLFYRVV